MAVTVIADDLTGACDAGAMFAGRAPVPVLTVTVAIETDAPAVAIDTESRALTAGEALHSPDRPDPAHFLDLGDCRKAHHLPRLLAEHVAGLSR